MLLFPVGEEYANSRYLDPESKWRPTSNKKLHKNFVVTVAAVVFAF